MQSYELMPPTAIRSLQLKGNEDLHSRKKTFSLHDVLINELEGKRLWGQQGRKTCILNSLE